MSDSASRKRLRKLAQSIEPLVQIGKHGLTEAALKNIDRALGNHELIKVKFIEHKEEKRELSREIAEKTHGELVDVIGNTAILYRQNPDPAKRKLKLQ